MKKLAAPMKSFGNLILMTVICLVIFWIFMALRPAHAIEDDSGEGMACYDDGTGCRPCKTDRECAEGLGTRPSARVTVAPPYQGSPPIGWVYGPYTRCAAAVPVPPGCFMWAVNVPADGLNVRTVPNGPPVMALVNETLVVPIRREGDWLLVAAGCDLTPTFAWSWTAGVPLNRCWVYF